MADVPRATPDRTVEIPTSVGAAQALLRTPAGAARGLLVLGHGAGGGVATPDLEIVTAEAAGLGYIVARVLQPYRVAGRRAPAPAPTLDAAWTEIVAVLRRRRRSLPLVVGGRSSGARVACRTAAVVGASAVLCLAFPLHPPGRPEKSRLPELDGVDLPVLLLSGERDPFGVPPAAPGRRLVVLPGRVHSLGGPVGPIRSETHEWLARLIGE